MRGSMAAKGVPSAFDKIAIATSAPSRPSPQASRRSGPRGARVRTESSPPRWALIAAWLAAASATTANTIGFVSYMWIVGHHLPSGEASSVVGDWLDRFVVVGGVTMALGVAAGGAALVGLQRFHAPWARAAATPR
jgi:hypothetical protein